MVEDMNAEYRDLVQIFTGDQPEVTVVRSLLQSHGIECFLPDWNIKIADPFITGGNALAMALVCPVSQATEALRIIEESRTTDLPEQPAEEEERSDLEHLGVRVRWAAIHILTIPYGAWLGMRYLVRSHSAPVGSRDHVFAAAAAIFNILATLGAILIGLLLLVR